MDVQIKKDNVFIGIPMKNRRFVVDKETLNTILSDNGFQETFYLNIKNLGNELFSIYFQDKKDVPFDRNNIYFPGHDNINIERKLT